jgi:DNA-directed RNA polymerase specialized sigma24 family protein
MTVRLPHVTDEHRASRLVDENYDRLKIEVIQTVESRLIAEHHVKMARVDVEAGYNVAWHNIWKKVSKGEQVRKLTGFLVDTTYLRALDIYRTRHEGQHADADVSLQPHHADVADVVDDQLRLERLLGSLQTSLTEREQKGILLCIVHGYSRQEAAEALEMKLSVFKRVMDTATRKLAVVTGEVETRGCGDEEWRRAVAAFAVGDSATEAERVRVEAHVEGCGRCRRYVAGLRGFQGLFPPVGLSALHFGPAGIAGLLARAARRIHRLIFGAGHSTTAAGSGAAGGAGWAGGGVVVSKAGLLAIAAAGVATVTAVGVGVHVVHHATGAHAQPRHGLTVPQTALTPQTTIRPTYAGPPTGAQTQVKHPRRSEFVPQARRRALSQAEREFGRKTHAAITTTTTSSNAHTATSGAAAPPTSFSTEASESVEREFGPEEPPAKQR